MKICTKCGTQNPDLYNFCSSCGQKLETPTVSTQPQQTSYTAPVYNQSQQTNSSSQCQIVFNRPNTFMWSFNKFHIKVDGTVSYELSNDGTITIPMSFGYHSVEISVFGIPRKTKFNFQATGDMTFICKPNPVANLSMLVTDSNGRKY